MTMSAIKAIHMTKATSTIKAVQMTKAMSMREAMTIAMPEAMTEPMSTSAIAMKWYRCRSEYCPPVNNVPPQ